MNSRGASLLAAEDLSPTLSKMHVFRNVFNEHTKEKHNHIIGFQIRAAHRQVRR